MPDLYTYIIPVDDGVAPHPFGGVCTLAICKPRIRKAAEVDDWVAGFGSKNAPGRLDLSGKLVYAMKVKEKLTYEEYDKRCRVSWPRRIPDVSSLDLTRRLGDCIYGYSMTGVPRQRPGAHDKANILKDLNGLNVLISDEFFYFGTSAVDVPKNLQSIVPNNQNHRCKMNESLVDHFEKWMTKLQNKFAFGMHGWPHYFLDQLLSYGTGSCSGKHGIPCRKS